MELFPGQPNRIDQSWASGPLATKTLHSNAFLFGSCLGVTAQRGGHTPVMDEPMNQSLVLAARYYHCDCTNSGATPVREFANRVQSSLYAMSVKTAPRTRDRGIRKAPFIVLIGATMPSVLAEVGFISNPRDESIMKRGDYRERIAEALYKGLSGYASTLSHFQVAQRHD